MAVYPLALAAALLFAVGAVIQQRVAFVAPPGRTLRPSLLLWLVRQPVWLVGVGTALIGNLLSAAALGIASVALVQPLLASRLLFALPLAAAWMRQRLARRDWLGAVVTAGGLAAFIAVGRPQPAADAGAPWWRWLVAGGAIGLVTGILVLFTRRQRPAREAPVLGAGAGMLFGLQSGLTHTAVRSFLDGGPVALMLNWTTYAVPVTAVLGTLLAQSAYELAPLPASYPALAAVEPLAGIGIALGVLGGTLTLGPAPLAGAMVALVAMTAGIYTLAGSSLVTGQRAAMELRRLEELAYRVGEGLGHELAELAGSLRRLEEGARPVEPGPLAELHDRLHRIDGRLERLAALTAEIRRYGGGRLRPAGPAPPGQAGSPEHDRAMDQWRREIESREQRLRTEADKGRVRVAALARE